MRGAWKEIDGRNAAPITDTWQERKESLKVLRLSASNNSPLGLGMEVKTKNSHAILLKLRNRPSLTVKNYEIRLDEKLPRDLKSGKVHWRNRPLEYTREHFLPDPESRTVGIWIRLYDALRDFSTLFFCTYNAIVFWLIKMIILHPFPPRKKTETSRNTSFHFLTRPVREKIIILHRERAMIQVRSQDQCPLWRAKRKYPAQRYLFRYSFVWRFNFILERGKIFIYRENSLNAGSRYLRWIR